MSALNGHRARHQINRVRKLHRRQRIQALLAGLRTKATEIAAPTDAPSGPAKTAAAT